MSTRRSGALTNGSKQPAPALHSADGSKDVLHSALLAPHLRSFALALHVVGVNAAGILHLYDSLAATFVFHDEVGHIPPLMFLAINPRDRNTVPLHPLNNVWVSFQAIHHSPL